MAVLACSARDTTRDGAPRATQQGEASSAAAALIVRGDSAYFRAAYDTATSLYEQAVRGAGEHGDSANVARARTNLALVAWRQSRFDEAKTIGEDALALKQRLGLKRDLAKSLNALGLLAQNRGQLDEALHRFLEARAAAEAVNDSGFVAKARGNLGQVYQDLGEFDRARAEYLVMRAFAASTGDRRTEANALNNLGGLETAIGDPTQAIVWLTVALALYDSIDYAVGRENSRGQLAVAYAQRGELTRAFAYLDSALAIATKYGLREPETDDLVLMAELYDNAGDHVRALDFLRRARAVCESLEMQTKLGHVALAEARAYVALGNLRLARNRAGEAVALQRAAGARMDELDADLASAELAQRAGDSTAAAAALRAARAVTDSLDWGTARIKFALGMARVADVARKPRDVVAALDASARDTTLVTAEERAELETLRARAYFRMARYDLAAVAGRRAVASFERIRGNLAAGRLRTSYMSDRADAYADLVVTLLAMGRVDEAFRVADGARGRALVEHLGAATRGLPPSGSARDVAAADALLRRIDALIERLRFGDTSQTPKPNRSADPSSVTASQELAAARREYEGMLDRLARADPSSAILGANTIDVAAVRRALGVDEALLEFVSTTDRLVTFVVSRDRVRRVDVSAGSSELAERIRLARALVASRDRAARGPLAELYGTLIAPVERAGLLEGIRALVIVPHGALTYVPFAALWRADSGATGHYLVERFSIATLASASALPALRERSVAPLSTSAVVLAPRPSELPATRDEATAVARQFAHPRLAIGRSATEGLLRDALRNSAIVHVASHGTLNAESPMFSSLQLASPSADQRRTDEDGRLEVFEVLSLNVRSRLVFLSGCETALGTAWASSFARREDYATLAQAFLFAGADNVVATLWRIDDRGGADFADTFYQHLGTASPPQALAAAQRAFIGNPRYAAPYYWAAYTTSGSGRLTR